MVGKSVVCYVIQKVKINYKKLHKKSVKSVDRHVS